MERVAKELEGAVGTFIQQHVTAKEGARAEVAFWKIKVVLGDEEESMERVLVVTPLCFYLFHCSQFKRSVVEVNLLHLEALDAVSELGCKAQFVFDTSRTDSPIHRLSQPPDAQEETALRVSVLASETTMLEVIGTLLRHHAQLSRICPPAFSVTLTIPSTSVWDAVVPACVPASTGFCTDFFLSFYRGRGMIEKRRMVASFLFDLQECNDSVIDVDVFQCMCSGFDAEMDFTALAMYLMYDTHFTTLSAQEVTIGDVPLVCLLQTFENNTSIKSLDLVRAGTGPHASKMLGRSLLACGAEVAIESLTISDDGAHLTCIAPALASMFNLTSLCLSSITHHVRKMVRNEGTAGFAEVFTFLRPDKLTHLDLSRNFLTPRDFDGVTDWLARTSALQSLKLTNVGGVEWGAVFAALNGNEAVGSTLEVLDVAWNEGFELEEGRAGLVLFLGSCVSLRSLVLDGCSLKRSLLLDTLRPLLNNSHARDISLQLRDLDLSGEDWGKLSKLLLEPKATKWAGVGSVRELYLDRNQLGVGGLVEVCRTLLQYAPLKVLSLDQNLLEDEILSDDEGVHKSASTEALVQALCDIGKGEGVLRLECLSFRGDADAKGGCLGATAAALVIESLQNSESLKCVDLCYNALGEPGIHAVALLLAAKCSVQQLFVAPDLSLGISGWQGLLTCVEKAGAQGMMLCDANGIDNLFQNSVKTASSKKQQEMMGRILAQIKVTLSAAPPTDGVPFMQRLLPPIPPPDRFAEFQLGRGDSEGYDSESKMLANGELEKLDAVLDGKVQVPGKLGMLGRAASHQDTGKRKLANLSKFRSAKDVLRPLNEEHYGREDDDEEGDGHSSHSDSAPSHHVQLSAPTPGLDRKRVQSLGFDGSQHIGVGGFGSDLVASSLMDLKNGPLPSPSPSSLASPPLPMHSPQRLPSDPPTTPLVSLVAQSRQRPVLYSKKSTQLELASLPSALKEKWQKEMEESEGVLVWGKQLQMEPRQNVLSFRPRGRSSIGGEDPRRRRKSLVSLFTESFVMRGEDEHKQQQQRLVRSSSENHELRREGSSLSQLSDQIQGDHMRLLLRVCNKTGQVITPEDREQLVEVLCKLTAEQISSYQARARELLMPYVPSSRFKKRSALGGAPDVGLSKYAIAFHAGSELQPLTEVQYETISITSRSAGKVTFEIEDQPASNWPDYKFTVHPKRGVLKKNKSEEISVSFMAQRKVELKDLIVINLNGSLRLLVSVKADAEVPVFGVDPYSLELVSMNGVVLPRILDHLRTYLTNHGGLRLRGIFHRTPDTMLCYAIRQQINKQHAVSAKATEETLYSVAHMIKVFFMELPQPLLEPLPLANLVLGDKDHVNSVFKALSNQSMSLFVWVLDLLTDVVNHSEYNHCTMKSLVEQFAPCLHSPVHSDKVKALLYQQLSQSVSITATSHRTASINQMTNHATLKARVGHLVPSQSLSSVGMDKEGPGEAEAEEDEDPAAGLPPGWKLFHTRSPRKRPFYHNAKLNRTQWHKPSHEASSLVLPPGWTVHRTRTPQKRVFYHNKSLGKTQWHPPTS